MRELKRSIYIALISVIFLLSALLESANADSGTQSIVKTKEIYPLCESLLRYHDQPNKAYDLQTGTKILIETYQCQRFIQGVIDGYHAANFNHGISKEEICLNGASTYQISKMFLNFADKYSTSMEEPAAITIILAVNQQCKK